MIAAWMATTSGAAGLGYLTGLWVGLRTGLEESFDYPGRPQVSSVGVVDDVEVVVFVVAEVELELELEAAVVAVGPVAAAFEVAGMVAAAVAVAVAVAVDPFGQHNSEQTLKQNCPYLSHQDQQKLEVQGVVAHRLATSLAAFLARPSVGRVSSLLDVTSPLPAFDDPLPPSLVAIDALTRLHSSIVLEEGATGPSLMQLTPHVLKAEVSSMPVEVGYGTELPSPGLREVEQTWWV